MTYEIEKNVPMSAAAGRKAKYPFGSMEVGDSVFIPCEAGRSIVDMTATLRSCAIYAWGPRTVSASKEEKGGVLGVRVWRKA